MSVLWKSKAFWSALIAFAGVVVMRYTQVPAEIWQSFVGLALAIVGVFVADEVGVSVGRGMWRALEDTKQADLKSKKGSGVG